MCTATSGEYGMCLPENECIARRGILGGSCAQGYGICCICKHYRIYGFWHSYGLFCCCCFLVMASCGEIVRENGTYFVNPNHPNQVHSIFLYFIEIRSFQTKKIDFTRKYFIFIWIKYSTKVLEVASWRFWNWIQIFVKFVWIWNIFRYLGPSNWTMFAIQISF